MDNVPVKIAERYKPPPSVYQLPQTIVHRLTQQSSSHYHDQPDYQYDFQLERSVLSKAQRWRQMRQQQQDERQARQERRKQERQRAIEAQQKEMLGAVEYPSAAELSSDSDGESDQQSGVATAATKTVATNTSSISGAESPERPTTTLEPKSINSCNFNTILQPTVAPTPTPAATLHKRNSSLNYADFEYNMNSTPFDNIELKTINDLDILAQVLHNTQLKAQTEQQQEQDCEDAPAIVAEPPLPPQVELTVTTLAETKATLDSVHFHSHCDDDVDDEVHEKTKSHIPASQPQATPNSNSYAPVYPAAQQLQTYHMGYNQQYYQLYNNQNYLLAGQPAQHYVNGYGTPTHQPLMALSAAAVASVADSDAALKSQSVPDILRELKTELQRRSRNHSHNADQASPPPPPNHSHSQTQTIPKQFFLELAVPAQKLAQRISSMGFPLERVAKVVSLCGSDDKKIIEHLIPLGELLDLGFDEAKISAALLQFDNNKDKALDYLIN